MRASSVITTERSGSIVGLLYIMSPGLVDAVVPCELVPLMVLRNVVPVVELIVV